MLFPITHRRTNINNRQKIFLADKHVLPIRIALSCATILLAAALRIWPLGILGQRTVWLTFYPAVMITALIGGVLTGIIGTLASCVMVLFFWNFFSASPFINDKADWITLFVFILTCSGFSLLAESQRRAKLQAEQANRAKSAFLANMSHELRTPLNAILGFSRLMLQSGEMPEALKQNAEIIEQSGNNLLELINDVLDIAKIETGRTAAEKVPTNIGKILFEVQSLMNVSASKKDLALVIDFPADFPSAIITDPGKIRRILINLVGNAIKFTETGSIVIKLFISQNRNKNTLQCDVSDTGRGIPESDIPRLFSPFSQATNRRETDEGTGLGLAICRQSIEALGGSIKVKSTVGKGSTFSFSLPITLAEEQTKSPSSAESDEITGVETDGASIRILIADDNAANRTLLAGILQKSEIKYDIAKNGKEALDLCDSFSPNLIFMDIRMPDMDGKEAAARIKSRMEEKAPKLIALTAHAMEDEKAAILAAGFDGFIRKPYLEQEIWLSISQYLGLRPRNRQQCAAPAKRSKEKTIAGLRSLPIDILSELRNCIEMLDKDACRSVIQKIRATEPVLAADLRSMVDSLEYVELLPFLDECLEKNGVGR